MSARVWTREELDRVHPLPRPWRWQVDDDGRDDGDGHHLIAVDDTDAADGESAEVWVLDGWLESNRASVPADVALAVIVASQGLDSYEAMAAAMEQRAAGAQVRASVGGGFSDCIHAARADGQQREAAHVAAMLRRGTVQPC